MTVTRSYKETRSSRLSKTGEKPDIYVLYLLVLPGVSASAPPNTDKEVNRESKNGAADTSMSWLDEEAAEYCAPC